MKTTKTRTRRLAWALLAQTSALLLVVILSLLLSHFQALAQPVLEVTAASLEVEKEVNTTLAAPGDTLTYTIIIRNTGDEPADAWLTDTLPAELTYATSSLTATLGSFGVENDVITWTAEMYGHNYTTVITFSVEISSGIDYLNVVNTAQVTGTGELIEDSATTLVVAEVGNLDNAFTYKIVASDIAEPGDVLTYTIQIYNDGDFTVPGAWLTDDLPAELTYVPNSLDVSPPLGSAGFADGVITWTHDVGAGQLVQLCFSAQISPDLPYNNWITNTVEIVTPIQSFTRASGTYIRPDVYYRYFPFIFKRWPPTPYAPTLNNIDNTDEDGDYTVSWSYNDDNPDVPDPTTYTLHEATGADFTDPTEYYPISGTSYAFTDKDNGTYYYRVRGHNEYGPGEWSNVESTTVATFSYFDDFSDYQSGWPREWSRTRGALYEVRPYEHPKCPGSDCPYDGNGYIIARRSGSAPYARFGPGVAVPSADYEIEVKTRWWDAAYFATYQIFFGANGSFSDYYAVQVRINDVGDPPICEYSVVKNSIGTTYLQDWTGGSNIDCHPRRVNPNAPWNHWRIQREGKYITVWANDKKLGSWKDSAFGANRYFGVGCTLYEGFTPSKPEFDNWSVTPLP
jgi:uncharacterized repeat protein (TIGR01451 family)